MFFDEHLRAIYRDPIFQKSYDPLEIHHKLMIESQGKFSEWVSGRNALYDNRGDIQDQAKSQLIANSYQCELNLGKLAIKVFHLQEQTPLATALEILYHFLEWLEGKGKVGGNS